MASEQEVLIKELRDRNEAQAETIGGFLAIQSACREAGISFSWEDHDGIKVAILHDDRAIFDTPTLVTRLCAIAAQQYGKSPDYGSTLAELFARVLNEYKVQP